MPPVQKKQIKSGKYKITSQITNLTMEKPLFEDVLKIEIFHCHVRFLEGSILEKLLLVNFS